MWNPFAKTKGMPKNAVKVEAPVDVAQTPVATGPTIAAAVSPALKHFHVSEKSTRGIAMNHYTFMVDPKATKSQVRDAVKASYKVEVVKVTMIRLPAKQRTLGRHRGWTNARKKAIVVLKPGQSIAAAQP